MNGRTILRQNQKGERSSVTCLRHPYHPVKSFHDLAVPERPRVPCSYFHAAGFVRVVYLLLHALFYAQPMESKDFAKIISY